MKYELLVCKNSFKHLRWKQIFSIPVFYLIRILLINKFTMQNKKLSAYKHNYEKYKVTPNI